MPTDKQLAADYGQMIEADRGHMREAEQDGRQADAKEFAAAIASNAKALEALKRK